MGLGFSFGRLAYDRWLAFFWGRRGDNRDSHSRLILRFGLRTDGFAKWRESVALLAALGFFRDGHFDESRRHRSLLVVLPEVLFVL